MQFGTIPTEEAEGTILAHAVRAGSRLFKKGRVLSATDVVALVEAGVPQVVTARLETGDVPEDEAAAQLAGKCAGAKVRIGAPFTGRANFYAVTQGLVLIDAARVSAVNRVHEAITLATVAPFTRAAERQMLATVKIIPFSVPRPALDDALLRVANAPVVTVAPFIPKRIALISTLLPSTNPAIAEKNRAALDARLTALGSEIVFERRVAHDSGNLVGAIREAHTAGCDPILIFGASAITDRRDVIPAAIEASGGTVTHFGIPVDPGNLLLLGALGATVVIGLPSCARSPKLNGFDHILWRILADVTITSEDIGAMGVGGLLAEIPTRPQPRDERPVEVPRAPKIGAIVLAAGRSSRMGANKLLMSTDGKPMIRHAAEAACDSHADAVVAVTGHAAEDLGAELRGLPLHIAYNPDYSEGLSTSLKVGLRALPEDCDGAVVLLGDMPGVDASLINRLIAAFAPQDGRAICVATRRGTRGNPVLWGRRFFPEMLTIEGDMGARSLISAYEELVCEVEAGSDAPLTDIDTPEAMSAYKTRK